ncbi:hypothetical protein [Yersinia enterocolitica]|uniref:hypothetical protein n=1 Tax=Yersinia enterocolitica TaxID=630 RepID=UPI003F426AD5|nr:hypothetical protein [Yersinia enterocolitica]
MKIKNIVKQASVYATSPFVAFSIGAVVVMLLDVYVTKGIDSSLISACMNVVMATTAVLVFIEAKDYISKQTYQDGYKVAIELQSQLLPKTRSLNVFAYNGAALISVYTFFDHRNRQLRPELADRIKIYSEKNSKDLVELCGLYDSINEKLRLLGMYGWASTSSEKVAEKSKHDELTMLLEDFDVLLTYLSKFKIIYDEVLWRNHPDYIEIECEGEDAKPLFSNLYEGYSHKIFIEKVKIVGEEFYEKYNKFIKSHEAYFSSDSKIITTYFDEILKK